MHSLLNPTFFKRLITGIFLGIGFWSIFVYLPAIYFTFTLLIILALIIVFDFRRLFPITKPIFWLTLPLYPILPFALLISLNHNPLYHDLLFILFILIFSFDTGSYVVGSLIGRNRISRSISPKKTWEGVIGGLIFACIGLYLILWEQGIYKPFGLIFSFTLIVCTLSLLGDLFESWLKRRAHIKDSATYLPGHGGFLDRFDGIMFAVFFFYLFKDPLLALFFG